MTTDRAEHNARQASIFDRKVEEFRGPLPDYIQEARTMQEELCTLWTCSGTQLWMFMSKLV